MPDGVELIDERKYWLGKGKSYSFNLPKEWAHQHASDPNKSGGTLKIYGYSDRLILVPGDGGKDRVAYFTVERGKGVASINRIATAYVRGYDAVVLKGHPDFAAVNTLIPQIMQKFEVKVGTQDDRIRLDFGKETQPILDVLDAQMGLCKQLYLANDQLLDLEGARQETFKPLVETYGHEQDRIGYRVKRHLHTAAETPENLNSLKIGQLSHILYYYTIGERLEGLGDIYEKIFENLTDETLRSNSTNDLRMFSDFLSQSFYYAEASYKTREFEKIIVLREKKEDLQKKGRMILKRLENKPLKDGLLNLYMNVGRCEGIVGLASNILEDWAKICVADFQDQGTSASSGSLKIAATSAPSVG